VGLEEAGRREPESHHRTQANAEKAAKSQLAGKGGEVVIHGREGKIRDKDTVPPARDPKVMSRQVVDFDHL
jgi:hypothetical protein